MRSFVCRSVCARVSACVYARFCLGVHLWGEGGGRGTWMCIWKQLCVWVCGCGCGSVCFMCVCLSFWLVCVCVRPCVRMLNRATFVLTNRALHAPTHSYDFNCVREPNSDMIDAYNTTMGSLANPLPLLFPFLTRLHFLPGNRKYGFPFSSLFSLS